MANSPIPEYLFFQSDKPFYPMVTTFFSSIAGLQAFVDPSNPLNIKPNQRLPIQGKVHRQFSISVYELFQHHRGVHISSSQLTASLCCMLVNTAYESVKELITEKNNGSPTLEFFRHIRNAASHGNKFWFHTDQPKYCAMWRGKSIDYLQKGDANPLQKTVCFFDFVGPADVVLLLWDVEQILNTRNNTS